MKRMLLGVLVWTLCALAHATHTSPAAYRNIPAGTINHTVTFATVVAHETLVVFFSDRTGGAVINSISDSAGGTWTQRSTHTEGTTLTRVYVREDAAAATDLVVTIETSASQNSQVVGRRIATDAGGTRYPTYDNVATVAVFTSNTTAYNSNACAISAGGSTVGMMSMNNVQTADPTAGTFDSIGPTNTAGTRSWSTFRAHADAGGSPYSHAAVLDNAASGTYHVISFVDSPAGGASGLLRRRRSN